MTHHRACRTATDRSGSQTSIRTGASAVGLVAGARTCEADFVLVLFLHLDHLGHELLDDALLDDLRKTATHDTWCPSPRQNQSDHDTPRRMVRETCVVCGVWFMAVVLMSCLHNAVCKHPAPAARALHFIVYSLTRSLQHTRTWRGMEISRGSWIHLVCMTILGTCHHHTNPRAHAHQPSHVYIYIRIHIHIRACGHRVSRAWCRRGPHHG